MSDAHLPGQDQFRVIWPDSVDWQPFAAFPPAARLAVLVGNPSEPGPYVIPVRMPAGERMMPHAHAEDRVYTVISGVFYIGLGVRFDETKLTAHGPNSVLVLPSGQSHFHWAKSGAYITQVNGIGPLRLSYADPHDDPRRW